MGLLMCGMPVGAVVAESLAGSFLGPARPRPADAAAMGVFAVLPSLGFAAQPSLGWAVLLLVLTGTGISYTSASTTGSSPRCPRSCWGRR